MKILLIEDNRLMAKSLVKGLKNKGYSVEHCITGNEGEDFLLRHHGSIDLVLLDLMLPSKSGEEICKTVREKGIETPILMLTAKSDTTSKVEGFNAGADDYLTKPFAFEELLARISALTRRKPHIESENFPLAPDIFLNFTKKIVVKNGQEVSLSPKEFALLEALCKNAKITLSRDELFSQMSDFAAENWSNSVDVHIKNIRKKLFSDTHGDPIQTIRGIGYCLEPLE